MTSVSAIKSWDTKETSVKLQAVLGGHLTVVTTEAVTERRLNVHVFQGGQVLHATFQTAPVIWTVMDVVRVPHPLRTMKHLSASASKDGWVLLVRNPANLAHQQLTIFATVTIATMGLLVTCFAQTTAQIV